MTTPSLPTDAHRRAFVRRTLAYLAGASLLGLLVQLTFACLVSREDAARWMCEWPLPIGQVVVFLGGAALARRGGDFHSSRRWHLAGLAAHAVVQSLILAPVAVVLLGASGGWWLATAVLLAVAGGVAVVELSRGLDFYRADQCEAAALSLSSSLAAPFWFGGGLIYSALRPRD